MESILQGVSAPMIADILTLIVAGCIAGFIAGLFGVGGGTVTVPVLYHWFIHNGASEDIAMHVAVATSLATIIFSSFSSARAHNKKGSVDKDLLFIWGPFIALGSIAGVGLASILSGVSLRGVFGVFLLSISIYMLVSGEAKALFSKLPNFWGQRAMASVVGTISSLVGIGGGALTVPLLSIHNVPLTKAVGTSSAFGMIVAIPGAIGFILAGWSVAELPPYSLGYVSLTGLIILLPTATFMAPFGARLAHKVSRVFLKRIFAVFLMFVSIKMLWTFIV